MSRINTNIDSLIALNNLQRSNSALGVSLTRLSTGVRINSGKDDPAGLISGEFLRQEISSAKSAIANNNRANNLLSTADTALGEINNLLDAIRGLTVSSANTGVISQEELEANQLAVDSALSSINRVAQTTQFAGKKLLDGSLGLTVSGLQRFDSTTATLSDVQVHLANFNALGNTITVAVTVVSTARRATLALAAATATADSTIEVVGNKGSVVLTIQSGQAVASAINGVSDVTGVTASGANLNSVGYGANSFVTVRNLTGTLLANSESTASGVDANVTVNGQKAAADGLRISLNTSNLELSLSLAEIAADGNAVSFGITGGGANFQLGLEINQSNQINIGFHSFTAANLGSVYANASGTVLNRSLASIQTGGVNSLVSGNSSIAADIVKSAISQVSGARARLGALQKNTIESNLNSLGITLENLSAARSNIVDTDFAEETANLTRLQILVQAGNSSLAIANSRPQSVLSLLSGR